MSVKLFVGNVSSRTTKSQLVEYFSAAGRVASVNVPLDRETGKPRGFCFVEFVDRAAAEQAFVVLRGRELDGRELRLSWAREKSPAGAGRGAKGFPGVPDPFSTEVSLETVDVPGTSEAVWSEDYTRERRPKEGRHGRHGSDRKHRHGTRRVIE